MADEHGLTAAVAVDEERVVDPSQTAVDDAGDADTAGVWAAAAVIGDPSAELVNDLEQRKKRLMAEKQQVARDLRNADRKRVRLLEKARGLKDSDLLDIIGSRAADKAKASAKAKAKAKAAA